MTISTTRHGAVILLTMENGPLNRLGASGGHLRALIDALDAASNDMSCHAIVLTGAGSVFSGGADLQGAGNETTAVELREAVARVEASTKPVIMAIHGAAFGGGLEFALAGHYRIAHKDALFRLHEVNFGVMPGAGGSQRLPRLIGAGPALGMMLTGNSISAQKAAALGLIDEVIEDDVVAAATAFTPDADLSMRRTGSLPPPADLADAVIAARAALPPSRSGSAEAIIGSVAQITGDLAAGLAHEALEFDRLLASEASRGLRHAFSGEQAVAHIPGIPGDLAPRRIERVAIIGGGTMGTGIAIALLNAGLQVSMIELREDTLSRAMATITRNIARDVDKGRIDQAEADARIARLTGATAYAELADADLVIEAVFEDVSIKRQLFKAVEALVRPEAILASNTSTLNLDEIAQAVSDPSHVVGLHFFSPANIMRLLEVVRGEHTAPDVLATAMALGKRMGKVAVVSGVCDGFIGNRMFEEYLRQVYFMLEEGALPQQIDAALERWGFAMGPCRTMDLAGQDIGWAIRKRRAVEQPDRPYSTVIDRICERGRFGQKTGKGIYLYEDGRTATPDPEIEALIVAHSAEIGLTRRRISDDEIVERCLLALINEGLRIVGEGIAYRPVDVDMVFLHGYGFARDRGGPMFQADEIGARELLARLTRLAAGRHGWAWAPAPLVEEMAATGEAFSKLNA
ncbi:3-hydroxyacyl-CoA dehydrogenase [Sphingobium sp. LB126]|uniref:3-hydroxyacyl-CoA dehydrogenase NAD-binding domain-containing protein n=1 Tax=Sphingobium sp. LB126 TaxID=1983755 RepID=UPI000C1FE097|nr:3-hydroxyacyl-CoA dehydrogenase NAD-binding domain-containing protein [Sphingobium sp. LB126]PJG46401.1 3-hydroxyacyl-CoA dehydrogenase [Sphingobium sp. LB126]